MTAAPAAAAGASPVAGATRGRALSRRRARQVPSGRGPENEARSVDGSTHRDCPVFTPERYDRCEMRPLGHMSDWSDSIPPSRLGEKV
ncbi:hypothetical protein GCM10010512_11590 [Streptomyces thermoviolaceus subsp. thermoviolaceus]|nr:hypothetical protein GCM10010499_14540 [Streptomyces thermoviolaceus subsp. apingens]GHA81747.1 hypothetical protein GCM10010512_11590 [Streptomyces thermoviolaceus subsp. thermoviolaceus]